MPLLAKILIPLGVLAAAGTAIALSEGEARAEPKPKPSGGDGKLPIELQNRIRAALGTADPTVIRQVADEVEKAGFKKQADALRAAARAIEEAMEDVDPLPPAPGPKPRPGEAPAKMGRVIRVKPGNGPFQVAQRVFGAAAGNHTRELRDFNIPRDADGVERKSDGKGGFDPGLQPGDRLLVPANWPDHPEITFERIGVPAAAVSGEDEESNAHLRKLAGRVALEVEQKPKGKENRELIATFQRAAKARGQHRGDCRGLFDAQTLRTIAICHGIVPPLRFADGREIYWPQNAKPAKAKLQRVFRGLAARDHVRGEEWMQVAGDL